MNDDKNNEMGLPRCGQVGVGFVSAWAKRLSNGSSWKHHRRISKTETP